MTNENLRFLNISKGSAGELRSLLRVAVEIRHLAESDYEVLRAKTSRVSSYLAHQMRALSKVRNE